MKNNFFKFNWKVFAVTVVISIINFVLILQLIPVFEGSTLIAGIMNLVIFPPNFLFEDLFGASSVRIIDKLTWVLQFLYDYLIALIILEFVVKQPILK